MYTFTFMSSLLRSAYARYPTIAWVPTHNQIHHRLNNAEGDSSHAPKVFKGNHLLGLLIYPTLCGMSQSRDIWRFLGDLRRNNRAAYIDAISQYVVFIGIMVTLFILSWKKALLFFVIPQQFALFVIQVFNYVQHVEAATGSRWNHSRNFVSPVLNVLLFNNGYHTVHHEKPGVHWSELPALHGEHKAKISPLLLIRSWWGYMAWTFLLRPLVPGAKGPQLDPL